MKIFFVLLLLLCLTDCHKSAVEPEEVKATIINYTVGFVACSGGYTLQMENDGLYRVLELPKPYDDAAKLKLPASVWIRYKTPTGSCSQTTGLIDVTAIRPQ
ncbi:hypothetical protein M0L20_29935 [Spirosoma sp. RP8]|uniref:Uncharacterized protein n=1 Tax=Spirosoma liriopis TaxID=2937440 RepID=A0ABT0HVB0_9BACT|nr:hypothetical protein [Spirosoma liriopis]MCK8496125.1 hypothetical protein [Spirosoma liriopis]